MRLKTRDNSGHTVIKKPSSSRKPWWHLLSKVRRFARTSGNISLQHAQLLSGSGGVKLTTRRRSSQVRWSIGGRRSDVGHPKAFLTGLMEHWWSPKRQLMREQNNKRKKLSSTDWFYGAWEIMYYTNKPTYWYIYRIANIVIASTNELSDKRW